MSAIERSSTFPSGSIVNGAEVENEFNSIFNAWNNHNSGVSIWTSLKAALLTMSGNIVMATNKITGLGAATAAGDAVQFEQLFLWQAPVTAIYATETTTTGATYTDSGLAASITPGISSRRIEVLVSVPCQCNASAESDNQMYVNIVRGSTQILETRVGTAFSGAVTQNWLGHVSLSIIDSPATTSSTTYKVQFKRVSAGTGSARIQANNATSTIILKEYT